MLFLKLFWKQIALVLLVLGGLVAVYERGHYDGYEKAEVKYVKMINDETIKTNTKITAIEANSNTLVTESRIANEILAKDIKGILFGIKGKTLTIVKDGGCLPTQTFSDTFNTVNKRVNQNMRDAQK